MTLIIAVAAVLSLPVTQEDAAESKGLLRKGLEASVKQGGFTLKGTVDHENPFSAMGVSVPGMSAGDLAGEFTGSVASDGTLALQVKAANGQYELYRKGQKIVQRQTWSGTQPQAGNFAGEATALAHLAGILKQVEKAQGLKRLPPKKVGEAECDVVVASLPAGLIADTDEGDAGAAFRFKMIELQKVEATFYLARETGLVQRLEVRLTRGLSELIRANIPGAAGDEGEDKKKDDKKKDEGNPGLPGVGNFGAMKFVSSYRISVVKYDPELKVEIPAEVKRHFME